MSLLDEQIRKARRRARGIDLARLAGLGEGVPPEAMASPQAIEDRRRLLAQTHADPDAAQLSFERLIAGNELQPINYLAHGVVAARPVCRITMNDPSGRLDGYATGFLIAPRVLLTNNHVFPNAETARLSIAEFDFELDLLDQPRTPVSFSLDPGTLFLTSPDLDYALVAVQPLSDAGKALDDYGYLPLLDSPDKVIEGEWMTIIQHPGGERKQVCVRENKLLTRTDDVLWYSTDTLGGSSGSPVFNNDWQVVALHHKGVPETKDGKIQTVDGRDFDETRDDETAIKWIANEGIRISHLVTALREKASGEPLLQPVLGMTPDQARTIMDGFASRLIGSHAAPVPTAAPTTVPASQPVLPSIQARTTPMATRSINLTLDIGDDGRVSVRQSGLVVPGGFTEAARTASTEASAPRPPQYDVPFDSDYGPNGKRKGYKPDYLGNLSIPLPDLGSLATEVTRLIQPVAGNDHVLNYRGYSVVMHATRKFAIYTAANVDGRDRFHLRRPHDEWRFDPRIPQSAQVGGYYYANNQFDRGHLTRYEDMQYGTSPTDALATAADTLHFTNCTPQHAKFNQGKQLWQGLEQDVLEQSIEAKQFRAIVMTGPVLDAGDPVWDRYPDIRYPLKYWKIAVALTGEDKPFAAGFVLDQSEVIAQYGIEATEAPPFAPFKTYQVPIAEIERLTGLTFPMGKDQRLSDADPLADNATRREALSRARVSTTEAASTTGTVPYGYVPLTDGSEIVRPRQ